jgi:hypothetical protein
VYGGEGEEEEFISSFGGSAEELIAGDGEEGGYGEGARDISSADWDCGAGVCEYSGGEGVGSIYVAGEDQGEYPVDVVLYGSQYREDCKLWVCIEGMEDGKYIQIGQNICWNRLGSMILVRNPWTRVLIPNVFFKKVGFSTASLSFNYLQFFITDCDMIFIYCIRMLDYYPPLAHEELDAYRRKVKQKNYLYSALLSQPAQSGSGLGAIPFALFSTLPAYVFFLLFCSGLTIFALKFDSELHPGGDSNVRNPRGGTLLSWFSWHPSLFFEKNKVLYFTEVLFIPICPRQKENTCDKAKDR